MAVQKVVKTRTKTNKTVSQLAVSRKETPATSKGPVLLRNSNFDPSYFVWPNVFWMLTISVGILLLIMAAFAPKSIPAFLGPVATLVVFMGTTYPNLCIYLCALALVSHITQAAFAGKVCHDRGMMTSATIKWVLATFLFGFSSLVLRLLPYKPDFKTR